MRDFNQVVDRNLARAQAIFDSLLPEDPEEIEKREERRLWKDEQRIDNYEYERG